MGNIIRRITLFVATLLSALALMFANSISTFAIDVQYDTSFSADGYEIIDGSPFITHEISYDVAFQWDGKMITVGSRIPDTSFAQEAVMRRFNVNGTPDSSFGTDGVVSLDFGTGTNQFKSVAIQSDGKIVVVGDTIDLDRNALLARFTASGSLDTSFSTNGYEIYDEISGAPGPDYFSDVLIDGSGNILLSGRSNADAVLVRVSSTGSLDTSFNSDGVATLSVAGAGGFDVYSSIALSGNDIFVAGYSQASESDALIAKYTTSGSLDTSFDSEGYLLLAGIAGDIAHHDTASRIEVDGGDLVIVGKTYNPSAPYNGEVGYIIRLSPTGAFDTSFSSDGVHILADSDWVEDLKVTDDYYYLAGTDFRTFLGPSDPSIWRFTKSGVLDTDFDGDGQMKLTELNHFAVTWGILYGIDVTDGQIFVAGTPFDNATSAEVTSVARIAFGNQAVNLPPDSGITDTLGNLIVNPLSGEQTVRLQDTTLNVPVVEFSADFTATDIDLSGVIIDSSIADGKAVVFGLTGTHAIYVPKRLGDNSVIICPDAQILADVFEGCSNQQTFVEADPNVEIVNIGGQDFWKVSGLTGTGGISATIALGALSPTGQATINSFVGSMLILAVLLAINRKHYRHLL